MLVDLSHYEFVRVSGTDRHKFLQGQVSCDITQLTPERSLRGALCNLKGRVVADFRVAEYGEDIFLQTGQGMAALIAGVLKKYAVFSKVELQVLEDTAVCIGILGDDGEAQLKKQFPTLPQTPHQVVTSNELLLVRPNGEAKRFELWDLSGSNSNIDSFRMTDDSSQLHWQAVEMRSGEIHVSPESSGEYTPQLLNYDISGVINFRKGCYTGQEVVARMFYRAEAKKRLFLYSSSMPLDSALTFINAGERQYPVLKVVNAENGPQPEHLLFAVVDVDVVESGAELKAGTDTVLSRETLPYAAN